MLEIKIEPIENHLKFSNLIAINSCDYQQATKADETMRGGSGIQYYYKEVT